MRVGLGVDVHAFEEGRVLILGGVLVPEAPGLAGHSDADVLTHAIVDALLGAAGLGDIGERWPNIDQWKDVSSLEMLRQTSREVKRSGWVIENVDASLIAEAPRVANFRDQMIGNIARCLEIDLGRVSIKGTTTDGLGLTGRREGIAAIAVALLDRQVQELE